MAVSSAHVSLSATSVTTHVDAILVQPIKANIFLIHHKSFTNKVFQNIHVFLAVVVIVLCLIKL